MSLYNHIFTSISLTITFLLIGNLIENHNVSSSPEFTIEKSGTNIKTKDAIGSSIQITSFIATIQNNQVILSWKTNSEVNNGLFLVEKSSNGSTFKEISKIAAVGNSKINNEYNVKDTDLPGKIAYYRLTLIDFEGIAKPYEILALSNEEKVSSDCKIKINPDPCLGKCNITFCDSKAASIDFFMFDFLGNALHTSLKNKKESSGLEFDTNNYLKPGVFISKTSTPLKNTEKKNTSPQ